MTATTATGTPAAAPASYDVEALRRDEFPWAGETVYLDHASIGPLPERTRRAVEYMAGRRARPFEIRYEDQFGALARGRQLVATLINADPDEIALATNTSYGLALASRALPLREGDVVIASDREFPANVYPWRRLGDRGVRFELIPTTDQGWPDEARILARLEGPRVRCLAVSLTQFASGYTVDLARLSAATRQRKQFLVVDAIQALGQQPFDVQAVPVDILACGGQKWLLSPWGSGFVYVRRELIRSLEPPFVSWMAFQGTDDFTRMCDYSDQFRDDARRFEFITLPFQDMVGMNQSLELLLALGVPAIQAHLAELQRPILDWADRREVPVRSPRESHRSGIVCVAPPRIEEAHHALRKARIYCSLREQALRLSPHCYNTVADMERVVEVLEGLV